MVCEKCPYLEKLKMHIWEELDDYARLKRARFGGLAGMLPNHQAEVEKLRAAKIAKENELTANIKAKVSELFIDALVRDLLDSAIIEDG